MPAIPHWVDEEPTLTTPPICSGCTSYVKAIFAFKNHSKLVPDKCAHEVGRGINLHGVICSRLTSRDHNLSISSEPGHTVVQPATTAAGKQAPKSAANCIVWIVEFPCT